MYFFFSAVEKADLMLSVRVWNIELWALTIHA
jgi:hypothetical protein